MPKNLIEQVSSTDASHPRFCVKNQQIKHDEVHDQNGKAVNGEEPWVYYCDCTVSNDLQTWNRPAPGNLDRCGSRTEAMYSLTSAYKEWCGMNKMHVKSCRALILTEWLLLFSIDKTEPVTTTYYSKGSRPMLNIGTGRRCIQYRCGVIIIIMTFSRTRRSHKSE